MIYNVLIAVNSESLRQPTVYEGQNAEILSVQTAGMSVHEVPVILYHANV